MINYYLCGSLCKLCGSLWPKILKNKSAFFPELVIIEKINKPQRHFIAMAHIENLPKVSKVIFISTSIDKLIVAQEIFPSQYKAAAETKIPG